MERTIVLQSFDGRDPFAVAVADRRDARTCGFAVDDDSAGAATAFAAAVLAPGQVEVVPQNAEQAPRRVGFDAVLSSIHLEVSGFDHRNLLAMTSGRTVCTIAATASSTLNLRLAAFARSPGRASPTAAVFGTP